MMSTISDLYSEFLISQDVFPPPEAKEAFIASGSQSIQNFSTSIISTLDGNELRRGVNSIVRHKYLISMGLKPLAVCAELSHFFKTKRGRLIGFFFSDPIDHTIKETIAVADGKSTSFQILKSYNDSKRHITRVEKATVFFGENAVPDNEYKISKFGNIIFETAPRRETEIKIRADFLIPVRFDTDSFSIEIRGGSMGFIADFSLIELLI